MLSLGEMVGEEELVRVTLITRKTQNTEYRIQNKEYRYRIQNTENHVKLPMYRIFVIWRLELNFMRANPIRGPLEGVALEMDVARQSHP
jgi:hypothetical protein